MFACLHLTQEPADGGEALLRCAASFAPHLEHTSPKTVTFLARGLRRLYGDWASIGEHILAEAWQRQLVVQVALAANPYAARRAAETRPGLTVIPAGEEAAFLDDLPVHLLQPTPAALKTLAGWGIHTFGELGRLPTAALVERLGPEGWQLQQQALGQSRHPLVLTAPTPVLQAEALLEDAIQLLEPLSFLLGRLLEEVCTEAAKQGLSFAGFTLTLSLEDGGQHTCRLPLALPCCEHGNLLKLLRLRLAAQPPPAPVTALLLQGEPAAPRPAQGGLFLPPTPEPQRLELTLARIARLVGPQNVGSPILLDTHRPDAFRLQAFTVSVSSRATSPAPPVREDITLAFRCFRPPLPASVHLVQGTPVRMEAPGIRGELIVAAGPWRNSGEWWTFTEWARNEWDVVLRRGVHEELYRLLQSPANEWFVDGYYD